MPKRDPPAEVDLERGAARRPVGIAVPARGGSRDVRSPRCRRCAAGLRLQRRRTRSRRGCVQQERRDGNAARSQAARAAARPGPGVALGRACGRHRADSTAPPRLSLLARRRQLLHGGRDRACESASRALMASMLAPGSAPPARPGAVRARARTSELHCALLVGAEDRPASLEPHLAVRLRREGPDLDGESARSGFVTLARIAYDRWSGTSAARFSASTRLTAPPSGSAQRVNSSDAHLVGRPPHDDLRLSRWPGRRTLSTPIVPREGVAAPGSGSTSERRTKKRASESAGARRTRRARRWHEDRDERRTSCAHSLPLLLARLAEHDGFGMGLDVLDEVAQHRPASGQLVGVRAGVGGCRRPPSASNRAIHGALRRSRSRGACRATRAPWGRLVDLGVQVFTRTSASPSLCARPSARVDVLEGAVGAGEGSLHLGRPEQLARAAIAAPRLEHSSSADPPACP